MSIATEFTRDLLTVAFDQTKVPAAMVRDVCGVVKRFTGEDLSVEEVAEIAASAGVKVSPTGGKIAVSANQVRWSLTTVGLKAANVKSDTTWVRRPARWDEFVELAHSEHGVTLPKL